MGSGEGEVRENRVSCGAAWLCKTVFSIGFIAVAGAPFAKGSVNSTHLKVEEMIGAVLLSQSRGIVDLNHFSYRTDKHMSLDELLFSLRSSYDRLDYRERCEFALFTILFGDLDAGASLAFKQLIDRDAQKIRTDLTRIPDSVLRGRFGVNDERIKQFRAYIEQLSGR
jgi:hypothetical protein